MNEYPMGKYRPKSISKTIFRLWFFKTWTITFEKWDEPYMSVGKVAEEEWNNDLPYITEFIESELAAGKVYGTNKNNVQ